MPASSIGARVPPDLSRPHVRLVGQLKAGAATSNGGILYELVPVRGAARLRVRIKTATNGGTLDVFFVGPDFNQQQSGDGVAYASLAGTIYTTGNGTQAAVTAGTEAKIDVDCYGESYALLKFTGTTGAGTITYVDVAQV
jgi:hypothetical protein